MPIVTRRLSGRHREWKTGWLLSLAQGMLVLSLTACGGDPARDAPPPKPTPAPSVLEAIPPLDLRPGGSLGALGLNLDMLLAEPIDDPAVRAARLENVLRAIQRDLKTLAPAVQNLAGMEDALEQLIKAKDAPIPLHPAPPPPQPAVAPPAVTVTPKPVQPTPVAPKPAVPKPVVPKPIAPKVVAPPPAPAATKAPAATSGLRVVDMRLGEHADKTRIVFDVTGKAAARTELDNSEKILIVEIDDAAWSGAASKSFAASPMIQSYTTQALEGGAGTRIVIVLKKPATITAETAITPQPDTSLHRIVIDLGHG